MIGQLKTNITRLMEKFDALTSRERMLVFAGIMAVLYLVTINILVAPMWKDMVQLRSSLNNKTAQLKQVEAELRIVLAGGAVDPDAANRARLAQLEQQLKTIDTSLAAMVTGLVSPRQMAKLVEQILLARPKLQVIQVESLPPVSLLRSADSVGEGAVDIAQKAVIYRHGMRIEFRGRYHDIVSYLKAVEKLPWKVFWGEVILETEKYPYSKLTLITYTLSLQEGWIGV